MDLDARLKRVEDNQVMIMQRLDWVQQYLQFSYPLPPSAPPTSSLSLSTPASRLHSAPPTSHQPSVPPTYCQPTTPTSRSPSAPPTSWSPSAPPTSRSPSALPTLVPLTTPPTSHPPSAPSTSQPLSAPHNTWPLTASRPTNVRPLMPSSVNEQNMHPPSATSNFSLAPSTVTPSPYPHWHTVHHLTTSPTINSSPQPLSPLQLQCPSYLQPRYPFVTL